MQMEHHLHSERTEDTGQESGEAAPGEQDFGVVLVQEALCQEAAWCEEARRAGWLAWGLVDSFPLEAHASASPLGLFSEALGLPGPAGSPLQLTPAPHHHQIASELKDTISSRLRSARNSISVPIASTSDKVLGATLAGCELAWGVAKETAEYAANTRAGRLASGGADLALSGIEKVVELLLPPAKEESGTCR